MCKNTQVGLIEGVDNRLAKKEAAKWVRSASKNKYKKKKADLLIETIKQVELGEAFDDQMWNKSETHYKGNR